jgi:hypothetical protein
MQIQYVSRYIALSEEGLVPRMSCPTDQGLLYCNLNLEDQILLYCLECNYNKILGINSYEEIRGVVNEYEKNKYN